MAKLLAVFIGAGCGGVLRYLLGLAVSREYHGAFPLATFLINLLGCFAIGYLAALFSNVFPMRETLRLGLLVGVLGGFTTFSTFGRETFDLLGQGKPLVAAWYVVLSCVLGVLLVFAGHALARSIHAVPGA
jgi:fluoride exporter